MPSARHSSRTVARVMPSGQATARGVLELLGPINSGTEAALVAFLAGHEIGCPYELSQPVEGTHTRMVEEGFEKMNKDN